MVVIVVLWMTMDVHLYMMRVGGQVTHPINTPYQHTLSTHPINTPYQHTIARYPPIYPNTMNVSSPHRINSPSHPRMPSCNTLTHWNLSVVSYPLTSTPHLFLFVEPRFDIVTLLLDQNLDLLRGMDVRGATPLKYVSEDNWLQWCAYLFHQKVCGAHPPLLCTWYRSLNDISSISSMIPIRR